MYQPDPISPGAAVPCVGQPVVDLREVLADASVADTQLDSTDAGRRRGEELDDRTGPARARAPMVRTANASVAYLVASAGLAAVVAVDDRVTPVWVAFVGSLSLVALVTASLRLRTRRAASLASWQRDPFPAFAAALVVLVAPHVVILAHRPYDGAVAPYGWLSAEIAAGLAATGFLLMIRDMAPGRVLESFFLGVIGAISVGLAGWVALTHFFAGRLGVGSPPFELLAPVVFDLVVVGLGLQALHLRARSRRGSFLLVSAWTLVLSADIIRVLADVTGGTIAVRSTVVMGLLACGLLGTSALHPDSTHLCTTIVGPLTRLPRLQVALLGVAVLLGPAALSMGVREPDGRMLILPTSAVLSLLVVVHLLRLVQGRAVLEHRAHHDELTGLPNRTLFEERTAVAIARARRVGQHCAVLFLDLDRFKNVNDSLGHSTGNLLLQAVARRLRDATRAEDTVARLGGDEFVVFLPELDDPAEADAVAGNILRSFGEPFTLEGHRVFASLSIGIARFPEDGHDAHTLLENADIAMYRAKQQGRRTVCAYDRSMNDHAHERLALESRLHMAVELGELRLLYQPKVHLPTGRVMGMEALLRWQHPSLGLLEPSRFISVAEESGLILPVGEWALNEACRQNQEWVDAGFSHLVVAVNLSLRQFQQQRVEDIVARALRVSGLDPELLELEVTESLAMHDPDAVRSTLLDIRSLGVRCSIDDFGTGYSGLSHLAGFPVDKLKIDKSFVATIDTDREAPIVMAVVALAHGLGLEVVAEGVETPEQLERLRELGCDEMQGYLFSRPVTPDRFEQLLMLESVSQGPGRLVPFGTGPGRLVVTG